MANPETRLSKSFRKKLPPGHEVRVENSAGPGTPDFNFCYQGIEIWIEFKQVSDLPKRPDTPVFTNCLEPHQALWHIKRQGAKGRTYIVGGVLNEKLTFIIHGKHASEFNSMTLARLKELNLTLDEMLK